MPRPKWNIYNITSTPKAWGTAKERAEMLKSEDGDNHCRNESAGNDRGATLVDSEQYGCLHKTIPAGMATWMEEKGVGGT